MKQAATVGRFFVALLMVRCRWSVVSGSLSVYQYATYDEAGEVDLSKMSGIRPKAKTKDQRPNKQLTTDNGQLTTDQ
jgi:hypothetical protein